ncbi:MAG: site-specific integrase [Pirellulaceae bacterium]|nr:site-specific integrase [Planctomycetales bacterium]
MPRPNKIWFRKDTGWWMITIAGRKHRSAKGRENKDEAQRKFHELMAVRHEPVHVATPRVADLVESFLAYSQKRCAPDTYRNHRYYCQRFAEACGPRLVSELKPHHITWWMDKQSTWNQTTEHNARRLAHRVMSWGVEEGLIPSNPLKGMKIPPGKIRQRSLTPEEFKAIMSKAHGPFRILVWSLRQTGCRPSEAYRLTWDQVREDRWILFQHKTGEKTRKPRVIYLTPAMQRLMKYLRTRSNSQNVFVNSRGQAWNTNAVRFRMKRIKDACNLAADVCPYLLRHTFGTVAVMNRLNSSTVAELMGRTSTEMIDRVYVHLAD